MQVSHAEMLGIDLEQLKTESFTHPKHFGMLHQHQKRLDWWQSRNARHTETNTDVLEAYIRLKERQRNGNYGR